MTASPNANLSASPDSEQRGLAYVVVVVMLLFAWTHWHVFDLTGFAEDIGIVQALSEAADQGSLLDSVWPRIVGPLWGPGSTMWRPWGYSSLGVDAWLYGHDVRLWYVTNLVLHITVAAASAWLALAWLRSSYAAVAVFATMLLHPWSAEITFWLVGRFDGWASAAIICALLAGWHCRGWDRFLALSGACAVVAYASKESALILPAAMVALALARCYAATGSSTLNAQQLNARMTRAALIRALEARSAKRCSGRAR
jgi:hypothetical protein